MKNQLTKFRRTAVSTSILYAVAGVVAIAAVNTPVYAQSALEEIVVTAQRRSQSMQDVPISLEAVTGDYLQKQGYRALDELAQFTPSVIVEPEHLRPSMSVRGLGAATTDAFTVEQSTPIFLDGVHYARTSMIKLSFLDVQQVEILKGPQPVYFGQNAIAGAFNITSRKPTPEWEGYVDGSVANFGTKIVEAAIGGPITDTFGIRIAGKYDSADGYLQDVVSGAKFPNYENNAARIIAQWTPNEQFQATAKFDSASLEKGAEGIAICQRSTAATTPGTFTSVYFEPPLGTGAGTGINKVVFTPLPDCDDTGSQLGRSSNGPFSSPTGTFRDTDRLISIDIRDQGNALMQNYVGKNLLEGFEKMTPWSTYLDLKYELGNGITLSSLSSYDQFERETLRENRYGLTVNNTQYRDHNFRAISQELRVSSATGGAWDWMGGFYIQDIKEDYFAIFLRANTQQPIRFKNMEGEGQWKSAFANIAYNELLDGKLTVSVGARYSEVEKVTSIWGSTDRWVIRSNVTGDVSTPAYSSSGGCTTPLLAFGCTVAQVAANPLALNAGTGTGQSIWNGSTAIGFTRDRTPTANNWNGIQNPKGVFSGNEINPQVSLTYRLTDDHTFYGKYAESFKAGGADASLATIPTAAAATATCDSTCQYNRALDEFQFNPEYADHFEVGAKGLFLDGRLRYDVSAFQTSIKDLQIGATQALEFNSFISFTNAGEQKVKGIEFALDYAATDRLTLSGGGILMDNVMVDFIAACTEVELANPDATGCVPTPPNNTSGLIDRSGNRGANAPVWKFVLQADYEMPIFDDYILGLNVNSYISDGYITDNTGFSKVSMMRDHGDLSLNAAFSDADKNWEWSTFARNIFHPTPSYHIENDLTPEAFESRNRDTSDFVTYGVKFRYNFGN